MTSDHAPPATLSLDLDNLWAYQKSFGWGTHEALPSFLDHAVPMILGALDQWDLVVTVFVVGQDAASDACKGLLAEIAEAGHEIGNHSFHHDIAFPSWPALYVEKDIVRAEDAIAECIGNRPAGFRSPAFRLSTPILEVLLDRGYRYDASTFPTSIGALARVYKRLSSDLISEEARKQEGLYGGLAESRRPLRPYRWDLSGGSLVEMPVTTMPWLRLPFHGTYLNFLGDRSEFVARQFFRTALWACRTSGVPPSFLLHATDFLGSDSPFDLGFLPGMKRPAGQKVAFLGRLMDDYKRLFEVRPLGEYVDSSGRSMSLPSLKPEFH